jgi:hypothetical protein
MQVNYTFDNNTYVVNYYKSETETENKAIFNILIQLDFVKTNISKGELVKGIIFCKQITNSLIYAVKGLQNDLITLKKEL